MIKVENRVYGIIGIRSIMSNWNADFTGYPKTISNGDIFGSDKALKMPMKKYWNDKGMKVLGLKSLKTDEGKKGEIKIRPRSLKERYEQIFEVVDLKNEVDAKSVLSNLFLATDVKNFGVTFAENGFNIGVTGAVQIGQGFNKFEDTMVEEQKILSPYRDGKAKEKSKDGEDANATTIGTKIISDEAHYFYPFVVNPALYDEYIQMGVTDGYTEADYNEFKDAALVSATAFNTNAKLGCENEFALFVEVEKGLYLPDLAQYVTFTKGSDEGDKDIISLEIGDLINKFGDRIKSVEIYYNPYKTTINTNINSAKYFNIFTRAEA